MSDGLGNDELDDFTIEDQLDLLRSNALALALGTVSFLRSRGIAASEWASHLGMIFARGWDTDERWTPEEFLDATIVNLAAFGGETMQAEFGDEDATALIARFPDQERVAALELDQVDGDVLYELIAPIAHACGLEYRWQRQGEHVRLTIQAGAVAQ